MHGIVNSNNNVTCVRGCFGVKKVRVNRDFWHHRKIEKSEKKHHSASSEQQFRNLITFPV